MTTGSLRHRRLSTSKHEAFLLMKCTPIQRCRTGRRCWSWFKNYEKSIHVWQKCVRNKRFLHFSQWPWPL